MDRMAGVRLVRRLNSRHQRERTGLFVCEGEDLVAAALETGLVPEAALVDADRPVDVPHAELVESHVIAGLSTLPHAPRVIAVFRREDLPRGADRPVGLALWHVGDPGNVGTLVRTADAFGAFVALSAGCADPTGPRALRASAGAVFRVPTCHFDEASGWRVGLVAHGGEPLDEIVLGPATTFVLGSEREGLPGHVHCDARATIPSPGPTESLNVAAAGAIALYELARRATNTVSSPPV
jgi:TrmH family RNA methyltransferase